MRRSFQAWRPLILAVPVPLMLGTQSPSRCSGAPSDRGSVTVYMIRHGQAAHNTLSAFGSEALFARRRDASLEDTRLTQLGEEQAETAAAALARLLEKHGDDKPVVVVSSTLRRALQTAEKAALPSAAAGARLVALESACEIQFGDIWNEPRPRQSVEDEWPRWSVLPYEHWSGRGKPPLETADQLLERVEDVWLRISELPAPVVVFVGHSCLFAMFERRVKASFCDAVPGEVTMFGTAEVRRLQLPPPDGRHMTWREVTDEIGEPTNNFFARFSKRVEAIHAAGVGLAWAQKEWRYTKEHEDFVPPC